MMGRLRKNEQGFGLIEGLLILLVVAVVGFGGYYVYNNQQKTTKTSNPTSLSESTDYAEGYRGGTAGVKLTAPVLTVTTETLEILNIYFKQNKTYPESETVPMLQLWQKYGYNGASAGASLKCPDYNGHFSYTGYQDPASGEVISFNLYYCDGSKMVTKSQDDIL